MKALLFLLLLPVALLAQHAKTPSKVIYSLYITPQLNYPVASGLDDNEKYTSDFGFASGLNAGMKIADNISFHLGMGYQKTAYAHTSIGLVFECDILAGNAAPAKVEGGYSISELRFPIVFEYDFQKTGIFFNGGAAFSYPIANNSQSVISHSCGIAEKSKLDIRNILRISILLSAGYRIPLSQRLELSIGPSLEYYIHDNKEPMQLYKFGLAAIVTNTN